MKKGCLAIVFAVVCLLQVESIHGSVRGGNQENNQTLVAFMEKFLGPPSAGSALGARYMSTFVDLRDDGKREAIVYITDPDWCGSGGCTTLILEPEDSSYRVITKMTVVQLPIRLLKSKTNGWHDIGVWVQGGGIQPGYEAKLVFGGTTYPENPSMVEANPKNKKPEEK